MTHKTQKNIDSHNTHPSPQAAAERPWETLADKIKYFEGFRPHPYICPGGHLTAGYGHIMKDTDQGKRRRQPAISKEEAHAWLMHDLQLAHGYLMRACGVPLTHGQWMALMSFIFNVGVAAFRRSTLRRRLNRGAYDEAADEFERWIWAGGRKQAGLLKRRRWERNCFLGGFGI